MSDMSGRHARDVDVRVKGDVRGAQYEKETRDDASSTLEEEGTKRESKGSTERCEAAQAGEVEAGCGVHRGLVGERDGGNTADVRAVGVRQRVGRRHNVTTSVALYLNLLDHRVEVASRLVVRVVPAAAMMSFGRGSMCKQALTQSCHLPTRRYREQTRRCQRARCCKQRMSCHLV